MKTSIIHYNDTYLNLSETFIYNYIRHIEKYNVLVIANKVDNMDLFPYDQVYCFENQPKQSAVSLISNIKRIWFRRILFGKYCVQIIKNNNARLVHAHFGPRGYEMLQVKKSTGLPLITTFYGQDMSQFPRKKEWLNKYRSLFEEGDLFLTEGNCMKKGLCALGCPEEKIRIQRIAINVDKYNFRLRQNKKSGEKVVLFFCGRFVEKKGLLYALEAVNRVYRTFPDIEFRIVGDGEQRKDVENMIQENKMYSYVKLLGMQPHEKVLQEMDRADVFLQPSVTAANGDSEGGAPTTVLEAQACGVPVIATFHADIPEVVVDGESALLSRERDVPGLTSNILKLLTGDCSWTEMGRAGRSFIEKNHDIKQNVHKLEELYSSCL